MFRNIAKHHAGGCVMLARATGEKSLEIIGTAFLCHSKGYLLTAAHTFNLTDKLGFIPPKSVDEFNPAQLDDNISFISVEVAQHDAMNDVALLKITDSITVAVIDDLLGTDDLAPVGSSTCYLGFPHANNGQHALKVSGTVLSSKVISKYGTRQLLFDAMVETCNSGGPLIDVATGRVIGIVSGRFSPTGNSAAIRIGNHALGTESTISYASAVSHARELLKAEGLDGGI
jgi:serine protease Do